MPTFPFDVVILLHVNLCLRIFTHRTVALRWVGARGLLQKQINSS